MSDLNAKSRTRPAPWNKGKVVGHLGVNDLCHGGTVAGRVIVMQQKTKRPVQFEITEQTRESISRWIAHSSLKFDRYLFPSRNSNSSHLSTRQYARIVVDVTVARRPISDTQGAVSFSR